jgi:DNA mismatch repair protein MutL
LAERRAFASVLPMGRIHILDSALADQIAAGEVIERPASVVKELLENALDAGARSITVEIREGGGELMRVSDDGCGMDREDAALALLRHATSKIRSQSDLEAIATLGFRGEALPSIASVARIRLTTRRAEDLEGTEVTSEASAPPRVSPTGCAAGTSIEVRDLFFNVPARRKFLKSKATESAQIGEVCLRAALLDARLRLVLLRDGRRAAEYLPAADWAERAAHVLSDKRVRIEDEHAGVRVRAVLGAPEDSRSGAGALHVFVNGRPVRERNLARSVAFAYGSVMPPGRYPIGVVHLDVAAEEVDVNVHPQKAEVRFVRGREVNEAVTRVLARGLGTSAWKGPATRGPSFWRERLPAGPLAAALAPTAGEPGADPWGLDAAAAAGAPVPLPPPPSASPAPGQAALPYAPVRPVFPDLLRETWPSAAPAASGVAVESASPGQATSPGAAPVARPAPVSRYRALAQARQLFIIAESPAGLVVIDQHAADERIHYQRLRAQYAARDVRAQRLLLPERVELSEREAALIETHADQIALTGLEVALIGARSAAVRAVPALLRRAPPERLLRDLLDELSRSGERGFGDALDMALATMACHGAIRAGDPLSLQECQALLDSLALIEDFAGHCPHGRPIVFEIPFDELARKVGR